MKLRYLSVCSGIEAASVAWEPLGWEPIGFSEIEPFPCKVLKTRFPNVPNFGDMNNYAKWPIAPGSVDVLIGGTPCFSGDTLIITRRGLIPISDVLTGDEVLTHMNRWQKVLSTGNKFASTIIVKGQGDSAGIVTTPEHPFYSRKKYRVWDNPKRNWKSELSAIEWRAAQNMQGHLWASPVIWASSEPPPISSKGCEKESPPMSSALAWVIGRWVGDGWCRNDRHSYVLICCGKHEGSTVEEQLTLAGLHFAKTEERTTFRYQIACKALVRWLTDNFGSGASTKTMPTWLFGWSLRKYFLEGYISADGHSLPYGQRITTTSPKLALGLVLLAHSLGKSASRRLIHPNRICTIEGRQVSEKPTWQITIYNNTRSSVEADGHRWGLVRKVETGAPAQVFNLEVEGDNSYVADGIVVHNCQSFSVAGLRKGMVDPRGNLALVYLGLVNHVRPRWVIWENVPGVLSSDGGRDFGSLLGALDELGYGYAWRVLDAQYWGVAQRRRRVFLVGHLGDGSAATAVLFEQTGCDRNYPSRRQTGEGTSFSFEDSFGTSDDEEGLIECADPAPTVTHSGPPYSRTGNARVETDALVVMASGQSNAEVHEEISPTLTSLHEAPIFANKAVCFRPGMTCRLGDPRLSDIAPTLTAQPGDNHPACVVSEPISFGDAAIKTTNHQGDRVVGDGDIFPTLSAQGANNGGGPGSLLYQHTRAAVRRLTPVECERLQGFPDNWTRIPWRGKDEENCPDGVRYKAVGNSMAVPVIRWLGQRIEMVEEAIKSS